MSFNFPSGPTIGQVFNAAPNLYYVWDGTVWKQAGATQLLIAPTADSDNRIINGAMQISQENGSVSVGNGGYAADQWALAFNSTSAISANRSESVAAPGGGKTALGMSVSPADTSIAAGEYALWLTRLEGQQLADFFLGTPGSSKQFVIAFSCLFHVAGTYWISMTNGPTQTHTYCASYVVEPGDVGQWRRKQVVVPAGAINAGVWAVNESACMLLRFMTMCGSTYVGVAGMNAAAAIFAGPGQANALSSGSASYLTDVGLYKDSLLTGVAPPWQRPNYTDELIRCQRYWEKSYSYDVKHGTAGANPGTWWEIAGPGMTQLRSLGGTFKVPKRVIPVATLYSPGTGAAGVILSSSGPDVASSPYALNENSFLINTVLPAAGATGSWQWVASARL